MKIKPRNEWIENGIRFCEFHVDDANYFFKYGHKNLKFGGNLSVRKKMHEKPLMSWGQDEVNFSQYARHSKQWIGPNGERSILPKTTGYSIMVSAFQSRECGFGLNLRSDQLEQINCARRGKKYFDEVAAKEMKGSVLKKDLKDSPFVCYFEFGNGDYWNYDLMVLQLEDCIDCLKVLFPDYNQQFLLDHSSGHAKKRLGD